MDIWLRFALIFKDFEYFSTFPLTQQQQQYLYLYIVVVNIKEDTWNSKSEKVRWKKS